MRKERTHHFRIDKQDYLKNYISSLVNSFSILYDIMRNIRGLYYEDVISANGSCSQVKTFLFRS